MSKYSSNKIKKLLILFVTLLMPIKARTRAASSSVHAHALLKSSCATTLYPDICYSTLSTPRYFTPTTKKELIQLVINKTKETIQANYHSINNLLTTNTNLTKRANIALHDCLQMADGTLQLLDKVARDLRVLYTKKSLQQHADDLNTLMSTTITNKETCLECLSHDAHCKLLQKSIIVGQDHGGKMCSNVLAMIKNMTYTYTNNMANQANFNIGKLEENKVMLWPKWMSVGDKKLIRSGNVIPDVTVALDGSGNYTTVEAAVATAPSSSATRYVIKIGAGVYRENIFIPKTKTNLMFIGDERRDTIITAKKSVADGSTTYTSATVVVVGNRFLAREISFQNSAGPSGKQAVALAVRSDLSAFYKCGMVAYQDTLYVHSNRQFYVECLVVGTVDFIFGNAAVVFQNCDILARLPNPHQKNMVTAQGRTDPNQNTGIVIQQCTIGATSDLEPVQSTIPTYLGRPWREHSRTVVMHSSISDVINPAGWYPWAGDFALHTLYYREYQNKGPGADTSKRVRWEGWGVITDTNEAKSFTPGSFINGGNWLQSTGFPFSLGL